ncbi:DUF3054 domain-containing protein [Arthrobacter sp. H41]|uniref:DUF3054 domain-containing protein n=1 Tax=Arthrobacter sp. H41 TaxID=1312978 RepID=UPI000675E3AB|nr:DUF3054 domain-containing protein [Arthrobacter sp. H41]
MPKPPPTRSTFPWLGWFAVDLVLILGFAASGRNTHESGLSPAGILATAAPFLIACTTAWLVVRAWRTPSRVWPTGVGIWIITAALGLLLRFATGGGMAVSFQLVTLAALGVLLLLPRLAAMLPHRFGGGAPGPGAPGRAQGGTVLENPIPVKGHR